MLDDSLPFADCIDGSSHALDRMTDTVIGRLQSADQWRPLYDKPEVKTHRYDNVPRYCVTPRDIAFKKSHTHI